MKMSSPNLFVCVSEEREDREQGEREGEGTQGRISNTEFVVYYKSRKRELKAKLMNELFIVNRESES